MIYHGDCLTIMQEKSFTDRYKGKVSLLFADLPYKVTQNKWDNLIDPELMWPIFDETITPDGVIILTGLFGFLMETLRPLPKTYKYYDLVWAKKLPTNFLNADSRPLRLHENILVIYKKKHTYNPQFSFGKKPYSLEHKIASDNYGVAGGVNVSDGRRHPVSILEFAHDSTKYHPTQKPQDLMRYLILTYSNEGDIVLDPVCGSGSTLVAAKNLKRKYVGIEKEAEYLELIKHRLQTETTKTL